MNRLIDRTPLARPSSFILHPSSFLCLLFAGAAWADTTPVLTVPASPQELNIAVAVPKALLDEPASGVGKPRPRPAWWLVEEDHPGIRIPADRDLAIAADGSVALGGFQLVAIIPPAKDARGVRRFRLERSRHGPDRSATPFKIERLDDKSLEVCDQGQPVLVYNFGTVTRDWVPAKDNRRSRGCYIHPLYGLNGEVLTESAPKDHYHHHGIFWAWPHVSIGGHQYDLWTYKDIQQKFAAWLFPP